MIEKKELNLILGHLGNYNSNEEEKDFQRWLQKDAVNQVTFQEIKNVWDYTGSLQLSSETNVEEEWKILQEIRKTGVFTTKKNNTSKKVFIFLIILFAVIVIFFSLYQFFGNKI